MSAASILPFASRSVLVTGGAGFIGCNLADRIASEGGRVVVFDSLARPGVEGNLAWLRARHPERITALIGDVRDPRAVEQALDGVGVVFHFAAQTAVTTSLADPRADFEINALGTLNVIEAARMRREPPAVIFASTNKVYGSLADVPTVRTDEGYVPVDEGLRRAGVDEARPLDLHTPYGCSKGAAEQYVLDYGRSFGLKTAVLRMSCVYGPRQLGTEDQGWVAHFALAALEGEPITIFGDGWQVRDVIHVRDVVDAYVACARKIDGVAGRAFNIGGGPENAVSVRAALAEIVALTGQPAASAVMPWRTGDQRYYVSDTRLAQRTLGLGQPMDWRSGFADLVADLAGRRSPSLALAEATA